MKKLILIFLLVFSFNAIGQDIYIEKVDISGNVEQVIHEKLTDNDSGFVYGLNTLRHFDYTDTSGTFQLQGGGMITSCHNIKVDGTTTIQMDNIKVHATIFLMLKQDSTGGYTITLPTFMNLDTQPVVSTVANKMDVLIIMKMSGGYHLHSYVRYNDTF